MKGMVFTEFLEMVEEKFSPAVADKMITQATLPTGGVYTSVGTYDHRELVAMVVQLSGITGIPANTLVQAFGQHMFGRFATLYPRFFVGINSVFEFLPLIDNYIHPEVRKLYPDAELPRFSAKKIDADTLELIYRSSRHFGDLAEGLIKGCIVHFGEPMDVGREVFADAEGDALRFTISRKA